MIEDEAALAEALIEQRNAIADMIMQAAKIPGNGLDGKLLSLAEKVRNFQIKDLKKGTKS